MKFKHLNIKEREKIQEMLWNKQSMRQIAKELKISVSSISREINKNIPKEQKRYTPRLVDERAQEKRKSRRRKNSVTK
jgi:IS30 family transposase